MPGPYRCTDTPSITLPLSLGENFSLERDAISALQRQSLVPHLLSPFAILMKTRGRAAGVSGLGAVAAPRDGSLVRWQLGGKRKDCDSYGAPEHPPGKGERRIPAAAGSPRRSLPAKPPRLRRTKASGSAQTACNRICIPFPGWSKAAEAEALGDSRPEAPWRVWGSLRAGGAGWGPGRRVQQAQQEGAPAPRSLAR